MAAPLPMTTTAALRLIKVYVSTWHFRNHDPLKLNEMMEATYLQLGVRLKKIACQCLCNSPIWMVPKNYQVCCCDWLGFFGLQVQDSKMQKLSLHVRSLRPPWPSGSTPWAPLFSSTTPNNFESKIRSVVSFSTSLCSYASATCLCRRWGVGPLSGVQQWSSQRNCDSCHLWCSKQQKQHSRRKPSVSSVLDSVTREYPSTKMPEALSCFVQCNIPLGMQGKVHMSKVYQNAGACGCQHHVINKRGLLSSFLLQSSVCISGFQEEGYEDMRGEIEMLQQCRRPNVVRYFGSYQGVKYLWIINYCATIHQA